MKKTNDILPEYAYKKMLFCLDHRKWKQAQFWFSEMVRLLK